jgi:hypothetical protein
MTLAATSRVTRKAPRAVKCRESDEAPAAARPAANARRERPPRNARPVRPDAIPARGPAGCAILTDGGLTVVAMATTEERLGTLEVRLDNLETWAGPGQASALVAGQRELRADLAKIRQTQDQHTRALADLRSDVATLKTDIASLKTDVATLKTDMSEVKDTVREILTRLPPRPGDPSTGS